MATTSIVSRSGQPRQQIEIGDIQSAGIGNPVGDRDHDRRGPATPTIDDQAFPQGVLVAGARGGHAALVGAKGRRQHPRLLQHPLGAAIEFGIAPQRLFEQLLEARDLLALTPKLIVEAEHLGDQAGTQLAHGRRADAERDGGCPGRRPARSRRARSGVSRRGGFDEAAGRRS